mmetsp:Transcript_1713/g.3236  ORF Transcript_1713/g.3236 Transcript_1713/m.3236 type:complete len:224 (+) Transcript_1713:1239-1910(+)
MSGMLTNESSSWSSPPTSLYSLSLSSFSLGERGSLAGGRLLGFCFCLAAPANGRDDNKDDKDGNNDNDDISVYTYIDNDLGCKCTTCLESLIPLRSVMIPTIGAAVVVTAGAAKVVAVVLSVVVLAAAAAVNHSALLSCTCSVPEPLSTESSLGEVGRVTGVLQLLSVLLLLPPLFRSPVSKLASFFSKWSWWSKEKNLRLSLLLLLAFVRLLLVLVLILMLS